MIILLESDFHFDFLLGVIQQSILDSNSNEKKVGWAFGIGLERIAMVHFMSFIGWLVLR